MPRRTPHPVPPPARVYVAPARLLVTGVLLGLLWSPHASADPKDDARRHFVAGLANAQQKNYQEALDEFMAAQAAWPHPSTLYNIARSYADLGQLQQAIDYYRLYAEALPEKKEDVAPVIAVMEAQLRQQTAAAAVPEAPGSAPATTTLPTAAVQPAAARPADIERLQALAAELQALSTALAAPPQAASGSPAGAATTEGTPTASVPTAPVPTSPGGSDPAPGPMPAQGDLLSDAYKRVVVTASRYGQDPLDSPSTVTILTEDEIRLSGANNLPDLLRHVAGVDVMALSAAEPDVSIRGFNRELSNKVLVLIDGRSVYLDTLGTIIWASIPISLDEVERIEIIRGPGSAVYGANAMTGVINILTRQPGAGRTLAHVQAGNGGYADGAAVADGRKGNTAWRMSAGWRQTGRWSTDADPTIQTAVVPFHEDQDLSSAVARANGRVDIAFLDKGLASASAGWTQGSSEVYNLGALGDFGLDFQSGYARVDAAYGPVHFRTFYNSMVGDTGPWLQYAGARDLDTHFDNDVVDAELEDLSSFETGPVDHRLNVGVGYRYKHVVWDYLLGGEPITEHHLNAFFQEEAKIGPAALVASLRVDKHPLVPLAQTVSPRGAAIVRVAPKTSVRATGGTSFRTPAFLESYLDLNQPTTADGVYVHTVGRQDLAPERILTGEVGLHDESTTVHTADLAVYVNRVTSLIGLTDVEPALSPYDPDANGFSAGTTGFTNLPYVYTAVGGEGEVRFFPLDGFDVYANLAIERVTEDDDGVVVPDKSTSLVKANAGVSYRSPWRVDVAAHVSYVSDQAWRIREFDADGALQVTESPIAERTLLSARLSGRPLPSNALELAVSGWNLLALGQEGFREHPKGQLVGARVWGDATWRF